MTFQYFVVGVPDMNLVINGFAHHQLIVVGTGFNFSLGFRFSSLSHADDRE